ncbi:helix-turn-helix domain-containing protein [Corallococcus carmarthensis]|nr:helix-turn-helix domain-containing protein [Corallococcus carmarthensis]
MRHIERVLAREGGHVERAATKLGISRSSLYAKLKGWQHRGD